MKKIKDFLEDICSAVVMGIIIATWAMAIFLIPIEFISSIIHFSFNTTLWLHKGVVILFFSFGFIVAIAQQRL